jgi:septum site-determining protein MinC
MAAGTLVQGALFTVMVVRAGMLRDPEFGRELAVQVERSPRFFRNAPVVLDLKGADGFIEAADFVDARDVLREQTLALVGVQNAEPAQLAAATAAGLASFAPSATTPIRRAPRASSDSPGLDSPGPDSPPLDSPPPAEPSPAPPARTATRIVTEPVRSGTQIYARGGDLIVTAAVSAGAEVMADGNIHVYGRLRGRALAGAAGDTMARIFCTRLEAELISIAGRYLVSEQLPAEHQGGPAQIALVDDMLTITRS